MDIFGIIALAGGLAMFLYGMEVMGDGLKRGSGEALKRLLERVTKNTLLGVLTGTLVTAIIQSSTATIVLTVGLIGAGVLTLRQATSIVMGANIGTTVTAQIIRLMDIESGGNVVLEFFKPSTLAPISMVIGIILVMFIKGRRTRAIGDIATGFGILFTGLMSMTAAVQPLADSPAFAEFLTRFAEYPLLGILAGLVLTVIVQSSSATVGMLQALSATGAMTFSLVYPVIMGINLGTCITTAIMCSIGSARDAKRTGVVHIVFNTVGTVLFMIVMTILHRAGVFGTMWNSIVDSGDIANFQTLFNLITAIVLLPFVNVLMKLSLIIVKPDEAERVKAEELAMLDEKLMVSPALALAEAKNAIARMGSLASENMSLALKQLESYDVSVTQDIDVREERIDTFADRADNFLVSLAQETGPAEDVSQINLLMQAVPDFERIGDYATNIDELAQKLHEQHIMLSPTARQELELIGGAVHEIVRLTVEAFTQDDNRAARRIEPLEEVIDDLVLALRDNHTERLRSGVCTIQGGLVFLETLTYLERAADQCSSIGLHMLAREDERIREGHHAYLQNLHSAADGEYAAELKRRKKEYNL